MIISASMIGIKIMKKVFSLNFGMKHLMV